MNIHYVSKASAAAAFASIALGIFLSTASADSAVSNTAQPTNDASHRKPSVASCVVMERPKHTIRMCRCDPGWLSSMPSVDAAEMIRLFVGSPSCRTPISSSK
jgi:hypothetical protein